MHVHLRAEHTDSYIATVSDIITNTKHHADPYIHSAAEPNADCYASANTVTNSSRYANSDTDAQTCSKGESDAAASA